MTQIEDWDAKRYQQFRRRLSAWYQASGRDLPWRQTSDPYRIWISEIMLQQTTVATVIPYYGRFLNAFPNLEALANADEQDVLRLWEGLGYYSRARNIHKAAKFLVDHCDGEFPADPAELQELPGVGRYTAGAIASFAFNQRAPIVEANTLRLYCRLLGFDGNPRASAGQKLLWNFAEQVLPNTDPGEFNQSMMELGATICSPAHPECDECPVKTCCRAFTNNTQDSIPKLGKRPKITPLAEVTVVIYRDSQVLLWQNQPGEWWSGLWGFPRFTAPWKTEIDCEQGLSKRAATSLERRVLEETGIHVSSFDSLPLIRHSVTRYRISLYCFATQYMGGEIHCGERATRWVSPNDLDSHPLSMTARKVANTIKSRASDN